MGSKGYRPWPGSKGQRPLGSSQGQSPRLARHGAGCYSVRPNPRAARRGWRPGAPLEGQEPMKLQADRATLMKALAHVQSVVERRNTIPILANVMIAVRDGKLSLTATDMEIAIVEDVNASSSRNGACTAPAATLYEI